MRVIGIDLMLFIAQIPGSDIYLTADYGLYPRFSACFIEGNSPVHNAVIRTGYGSLAH